MPRVVYRPYGPLYPYFSCLQVYSPYGSLYLPVKGRERFRKPLGIKKKQLSYCNYRFLVVFIEVDARLSVINEGAWKPRSS
ncbi:uncharacterized protein RSE6_13559 [Rhynchosporium secalis]|uniref:Uncharacterized protein n=1 Tax=Rhynchosporium secalis TaxID=38038 RepID=A0A1E1MT47_RHYSE|nr:uncharacterized protein RSE6_13559 [Rhynchosporium secalis]